MSNAMTFLKSKEFIRLLDKGKDNTYLTPEEINDAIPAGIIDGTELDTIMLAIGEAQIEVHEDVYEEEEEGIKLDGSEAIEETLSREEKAELKSASTDPVKLYLKRMGSVALLTREGEVVIAKEIEDGEREIILSSLKSAHALEEIVKLKEKILSLEEYTEFVKDLVRGLDDESTQKEVDKVKDQIFAICDRVQKLLAQIIDEDGTLKKMSAEQQKEMTALSLALADLTFNRKIINSFVEPVKK